MIIKFDSSYAALAPDPPGGSRFGASYFQNLGTPRPLSHSQIDFRIPELLRKGLTHNFSKKSLRQIMNHADLYKEGTGGNFE
jgi:hypothetical protein